MVKRQKNDIYYFELKSKKSVNYSSKKDFQLRILIKDF